MQFRRGHLRYFATVADEGQITRAARKLHVTQPALSRAMGELESELGVRLIERHARGITLTPAGERFLVSARAAVAAWTDAVANARSHAEVDSSAVEFGFLGVPPGLDSPRVLEEFAQAHPAIELRFRELPFPYTPTKSWLADVDVGAGAIIVSHEHDRRGIGVTQGNRDQSARGIRERLRDGSRDRSDGATHSERCEHLLRIISAVGSYATGGRAAMVVEAPEARPCRLHGPV